MDSAHGTSRTRHSRLGRTSFILSLLALGAIVVFAILFFIPTFLLEPDVGAGDSPIETLAALALMLAYEIVFCLSCGALGLGIAALSRRERRKILAVMGIILSLPVLLATLALMLSNLFAVPTING